MCLAHFRGEGYSDAFCRNMQSVKENAEKNGYETAHGCDDICACCPNMKDGKCRDEEKVRRYDLAVKAALESGKEPRPADICTDCQWYFICAGQ